MPNHVHLIAVPANSQALAAAMGRTHADFARHFHLRHRTCGHVWQARYFSCPLDDAHLWQAMAYVERNPVRAHLVDLPEIFPWSSAPARLGKADASALLDLSEWQAQYTREQWKRALQSSINEEAFGRRLQESSRRGRPLGEPQFVERLEHRAGRPLLPLPVGRPRKPIQEGARISLQLSV
jgi:putative transposase